MRTLISRLSIICVFTFISTNLLAQNTFMVRGEIKDNTGNAIPSVTVQLKGSSIGVVTDPGGQYQLALPDGSGTLVFSSIGYTPAELPVNGKHTINITLQLASQSLGDVVVVGYGTQKKSDLTGSIVSISSKEIRNQAIANVSQALQGKAAGVYVASGSGQPGQTSIVRIRGFGTVNNNDPIYVVDGQIFHNLNSINPNDIESMEVLKDASATAIYGSQGANGVILVTTKKGRAGQDMVTTLDAYVGQKTNVGRYKMANSTAFYNFLKQATENDGGTLDPRITRQYEKGYSTDWWDAVSQKGFNQNYTLGVRSSGKKSRSYFSLGYYDDNGAIITTKYKRYTLKANNEYDLSSRITVGFNVGLEKDEYTNAGRANVDGRRDQYTDDGNLYTFGVITSADPFTPIINPLVNPDDPNYQYDKYAPTEYSYNTNPVAALRINQRNSTDLNLYGNVFGTVKLVKGLEYYAQYNWEINSNNNKVFAPIFHMVFSPDNLATQTAKYQDNTALTDFTNHTNAYTIEQRLNYNLTVGKHAFSIMGAMTYQSYMSRNVNASKSNAPGNDPSFRVLDAQTANDLVSGGRFESAILSYLGRINYTYGDRYLATVNFRADGSSTFAEGHKWGYFPSFSLGWRISNETFFKNSGLPKTISSLKLRGGWGQTGNQNISSSAPYTLIGTGAERRYNFGTDWVQGYYPTTSGNPLVEWETSQQTNFGLDAGLFNERLTFTADYYIKKTIGMLLQVPLPAIGGYTITGPYWAPSTSYPYSNAGDVQNKGFEFSVNYRGNAGQLHYNIGANISTYKTTITNLGNGSLPIYGITGGAMQSKNVVGGPMGRFFGVIQEGIFQNQKEVDDYAGPGGPIQPNAKPGDFKFADLNHNGIIDDSDRTFIGDPNPKLIYGFNLGLNFKGFDLSAYFQGIYGNKIYNSNKGNVLGAQNIPEAAYTKAWTGEGDQSVYPRMSLSDNNSNFRPSSWYVENGSYLRLQNVQLGYTIPAAFLEKIKVMQSCRIYISGQNLFTITKYTGPDPDIGSLNPLTIGYDPVRYPTAKTTMIGANITF